MHTTETLINLIRQFKLKRETMLARPTKATKNQYEKALRELLNVVTISEQLKLIK